MAALLCEGVCSLCLLKIEGGGGIVGRMGVWCGGVCGVGVVWGCLWCVDK